MMSIRYTWYLVDAKSLHNLPKNPVVLLINVAKMSLAKTIYRPDFQRIGARKKRPNSNA